MKFMKFVALVINLKGLYLHVIISFLYLIFYMYDCIYRIDELINYSVHLCNMHTVN